jgi:hypothetical protein
MVQAPALIEGIEALLRLADEGALVVADGKAEPVLREARAVVSEAKPMSTADVADHLYPSPKRGLAPGFPVSAS